MKRNLFLAPAVLGFLAGSSSGQSQPQAQAIPGRGMLTPMARVVTATINPPALSFLSNDPDASAGNMTPVTITVILENGVPSRNWQLWVQAGSATLQGCPSIPATSLRLQCASATVDGTPHPSVGNGNGSGICAAPIMPGTSRQLLASGRQGNNRRTYVITANSSFLDKWNYQADTTKSCIANLTYTFEAP